MQNEEEQNTIQVSYIRLHLQEHRARMVKIMNAYKKLR